MLASQRKSSGLGSSSRDSGESLKSLEFLSNLRILNGRREEKSGSIGEKRMNEKTSDAIDLRPRTWRFVSIKSVARVAGRNPN